MNTRQIRFLTLVRREATRFLKIKRQTLGAPLLETFLYISVFGAALGSRVGALHGYEYIVFVVPGLIMMAWATNAFANNSSSLLQQKFQRSIDDQLSSPASPFELLLAFSLGGFLRGLIVATLTFIAASVLVDVPVEHVLVLVPSLFLVGFFFAQLGVLVGLRAEQFDDVSFYQTFVLQPLIFLGGVFYSASLLPEPFETLTRFNPVYYMIGLVRYGFLGYSRDEHRALAARSSRPPRRSCSRSTTGCSRPATACAPDILAGRVRPLHRGEPRGRDARPEEARLMRHERVGTEHLLVALAADPTVAPLLAGLRPVARADARRRSCARSGLGDGSGPGELPFTPAARDALDATLSEAMQLGQDRVEPAHLLLGILRQRDGVARRVLLAAGATPREFREAVIESADSPGPRRRIAARRRPDAARDPRARRPGRGVAARARRRRGRRATDARLAASDAGLTMYAWRPRVSSPRSPGFR